MIPSVRRARYVIGLAMALLVIDSVSTASTAAPLPPESSDFSLTDLEERNEEQVRRNQEARARWAEWQRRMAADFDRMMKLDASAGIAMEATGRFLDAYAADNPFSKDDDRMRGIAQRRHDAAKNGSIEVEFALSDLTYERVPSTTYPQISMRLGETGDVVVRATLNSDGTVSTVAIQQSSGYPRLDGEASRAARAAKFKPLGWATSNAKYSVVIPFSFKLDR